MLTKIFGKYSNYGFQAIIKYWHRIDNSSNVLIYLENFLICCSVKISYVLQQELKLHDWLIKLLKEC